MLTTCINLPNGTETFLVPYSHKLGEIAADICFEGTSVDIQSNINPSQQPRGYGGVAVIWKKEIHHLIKPCKDGNERIQCIEFRQ